MAGDVMTVCGICNQPEGNDPKAHLCELEALEYYTTCSQACDDNGLETVLEGVGEYHREGNTLYLNPCPVCKESMEVSGWLDECDDCGELHYDGECE